MKCLICGADDSPMIFRGDPWCSDDCWKEWLRREADGTAT